MKFKDCVGRQIVPDYELTVKNFINYDGVNLDDTRMMKSKFTCFKPRYEVHDDVLLLPYQENYHIPSSGFFEHWLYDKFLNPIMIGNHYKPTLIGYKDHGLLPKYPFANFKAKGNVGRFYYMGMLNVHYGHFIQESLTRFWLALEKPNFIDDNVKFVFHCMKGFTEESKNKLFNSNLCQFLDVLGINRDNIVLVDQPMFFEQLIIPESAISISDGNCYLSEKAKNVWRYINQEMSSLGRKNVDLLSDKIYLSRRKVKNPIQGRVLVNEGELESELRLLGFDIVCPEDYDQNQMQAILSNTKVIIGAPGSGLQNSFFIPHPATTVGLTTKPIISINPGLNHQIHTDIICGHKTNAFIADHNVEISQMRWNVDLDKCIQFISKAL